MSVVLDFMRTRPQERVQSVGRPRQFAESPTLEEIMSPRSYIASAVLQSNAGTKSIRFIRLKKLEASPPLEMMSVQLIGRYWQRDVAAISETFEGAEQVDDFIVTLCQVVIKQDAVARLLEAVVNWTNDVSVACDLTPEGSLLRVSLEVEDMHQKRTGHATCRVIYQITPLFVEFVMETDQSCIRNFAEELKTWPTT